MILFRRMAMPALGIAGILFAAPFTVSAASDEHAGHDMSAMDHSKHDSTAGQHIHHGHGEGGFMFEYKFMRMTMDGLLDGTDSVDPADLTGTMMMPGPYMMSPTKMTMDMHMVMAMYGLNDKISMMAMLNYLKKDMDMISRMGAESTMESSGLGDTRLGVMYSVDKNLTASVELSIPTGSINEKGDMVMGGMMGTMSNVQMPYPMQLGSGTYDVIPSITYQDGSGAWTFGGQASYTYHVGENDNDYTLGNILEVAGYGKYSVNKSMTLSGRLAYMKWNEIEGADPDLNPMMTPTSDTDATGGKRVDLLLGISGHFAKSHMLSFEVGMPVLQDLNGPQMETDRLVSLSYQYMSM